VNPKLLATLALSFLGTIFATGGVPNHSQLHVLAPITHGNLTIFPVVGGTDYDTSHLLTLEEGVRAGSVIVTEAGSLQGLIRPARPVRYSQAEVNRLVLVNNSDRPLLLLAGEVVTGGKQDRVIGADRLVPAKSGPIDLSVFCVEPGRWIAQSDHFGTMSSLMAQPSVRVPAMAERNQQSVWANVADSRAAMLRAAPSPGRRAPNTTSYAKTMQAPEVQEKLRTLTADYDGILRDVRKAGAKGVVVAINGKITWADLFASSDLLEKYWQKLIRSYAAESITSAKQGGHVDEKMAQQFLDQLSGNREVIETEPGIFRRAEITGQGYKVFTLTALTPKLDFEVHLAKMSYVGDTHQQVRPVVVIR
jgi:hypothetical protein